MWWRNRSVGSVAVRSVASTIGVDVSAQAAHTDGAHGPSSAETTTSHGPKRAAAVHDERAHLSFVTGPAARRHVDGTGRGGQVVDDQRGVFDEHPQGTSRQPWPVDCGRALQHGVASSSLRRWCASEVTGVQGRWSRSGPAHNPVTGARPLRPGCRSAVRAGRWGPLALAGSTRPLHIGSPPPMTRRPTSTSSVHHQSLTSLPVLTPQAPPDRGHWVAECQRRREVRATLRRWAHR
jgi:hypothetical protein